MKKKFNLGPWIFLHFFKLSLTYNDERVIVLGKKKIFTSSSYLTFFKKLIFMDTYENILSRF